MNVQDSPVIYIVEDDPSVRNGLIRLMRSAELTARGYADAESFLEDIDAAAQGCVLLDMALPRVSGLETQALLNARFIDIPVIVISAHDEEETQARAMELGARLFMRKPIDDVALLDAIAQTLSGESVKRAGQ